MRLTGCWAMFPGGSCPGPVIVVARFSLHGGSRRQTRTKGSVLPCLRGGLRTAALFRVLPPVNSITHHCNCVLKRWCRPTRRTNRHVSPGLNLLRPRMGNVWMGGWARLITVPSVRLALHMLPGLFKVRWASREAVCATKTCSCGPAPLVAPSTTRSPRYCFVLPATRPSTPTARSNIRDSRCCFPILCCLSASRIHLCFRSPLRLARPILVSDSVTFRLTQSIWTPPFER